jgi:uncharacterized membrane protein YeaQ/YmgE (transglycosylase-associated protein family)
VGALASITFPGTRLQGWVASMAIGAVGSLSGGMLGQALYVHEAGETAGFFLALFCAAAFVTPYHVIARAYTTTTT